MFARFFGIAFGVWFAIAATVARGPGLVLLVLVVMWACYAAGRWRRPSTSIAMAEARAAAVNNVQVNLHERPGYPPARPRAHLELVATDVAIDRDELAGSIAGELDEGELHDGYVDWLALELSREASAEKTDT